MDLLTPLQGGATLENLTKNINEGIWEKPLGRGLADGIIPTNRVMSEIRG